MSIGRRMTREMDDNRSVGVDGSVVVPNEFLVSVSVPDYEHFRGVIESLRSELAAAARDHAADEGYSFMGPVHVEIHARDEYKIGSFDVEARLSERYAAAGTASLLLSDGRRVALGSEPVTVGRLPDCTVSLADRNVSRVHVEIRPHGTGYLLVDMGSTNGTAVNGSLVDQHQLANGDEIVVGQTTIRYELA